VRAEEYECLDQLEDHMWWFKGLRGNVLEILDGKIVDTFSLLDAGCGTGGMLCVLAEHFPQATLNGIDYSNDACDRCRRKSTATIQCGSVTSLPYTDKSFDVITSLDVLEYESVDVEKALLEFRRCLREKGLLLLNLPAYQWMVSYHDIAVGQTRRFTLGGMESELENHGFRIIYGTYWNTFFFPLMVLRRKVFVRQDGASDVKPFPAFIEAVFRYVMKAERYLIRKGLRMPFGGSVMVLAQKKL